MKLTPNDNGIEIRIGTFLLRVTEFELHSMPKIETAEIFRIANAIAALTSVGVPTEPCREPKDRMTRLQMETTLAVLGYDRRYPRKRLRTLFCVT